MKIGPKLLNSQTSKEMLGDAVYRVGKLMYKPSHPMQPQPQYDRLQGRVSVMNMMDRLCAGIDFVCKPLAKLAEKIAKKM